MLGEPAGPEGLFARPVSLPSQLSAQECWRRCGHMVGMQLLVLHAAREGRDGRFPVFTFSSQITGRAKTGLGEQACSGGNQPVQQPSMGRPGCAWLYRVLTGFG